MTPGHVHFYESAFLCGSADAVVNSAYPNYNFKHVSKFRISGKQANLRQMEFRAFCAKLQLPSNSRKSPQRPPFHERVEKLTQNNKLGFCSNFTGYGPPSATALAAMPVAATAAADPLGDEKVGKMMGGAHTARARRGNRG